MSTLLPVADALALVLAEAGVCQPVLTSPLIDALGCVLAEQIVSPIAVPGDDNSAMDGYALRVSDAGQALPVSQRIPAGQVGTRLEPGTAARIFTGAAIPPGADAVVMQENCSETEGRVVISGDIRVGQNIRPRGQDIVEGAAVLEPGRVLRPQDLGLLASIGRASVDVYQSLTVAVLSTGDELVEPGTAALRSGQLYNSNRYTLGGLIRGLNMQFLDGGIIPDDPDATARALTEAAATADCVITSGGVSVGEEDHVKSQVEKLGRLNLWRLAIKPGKPLAFGSIGDTPFIGLPGNPTSVFVTFCLIARPFLRKMQGVNEPAVPTFTAIAGFAIARAGGRQEYLRVSLEHTEQGLLATSFPNQSSGVLSSVSHANALAVIPPGKTVAEGDPVEVILLDTLI